MPTDEYRPLLHRDVAVQTAHELIDRSCPLLREVVNHASWAFHRCQAASNAIGEENEDLAAFVLYRQIIEMADGIEALFANSCVEAAVPVLRTAFASVDSSKPASCGRLKTGHHERVTETVQFYLTPAPSRKRPRSFRPF